LIAEDTVSCKCFSLYATPQLTQEIQVLGNQFLSDDENELASTDDWFPSKENKLSIKESKAPRKDSQGELGSKKMIARYGMFSPSLSSHQSFTPFLNDNIDLQDEDQPGRLSCTFILAPPETSS
jgi:hypothetical protein